MSNCPNRKESLKANLRGDAVIWPCGWDLVAVWVESSSYADRAWELCERDVNGCMGGIWQLGIGVCICVMGDCLCVGRTWHGEGVGYPWSESSSHHLVWHLRELRVSTGELGGDCGKVSPSTEHREGEEL